MHFFEDHIFFGYIYELLGKIKISSNNMQNHGYT